MQGRLKFVGFIVSAVLSAIAAGSNAQEYPVKPVKIVVTLSPGSTSDILARVLGNQLSKQLGQSFVIENRPGAGGMLAAEAVAKAPVDGYTLLGNSIATHGIGPSLYPKLSFDPMRDFAPVALVASSPNVLIVGTGVAARTVPELIALIRAAPERFTFSSGGNGTSHHMGLDVHDVGTMHFPISAGMVFTVEPGIYIPEEGFAVRIENNIVVQENGYLDLMRNIPVEAEEIESLMNR